MKLKPINEISYYIITLTCETNKWFIVLDIFTVAVHTRVGN